MHRSLLLFTLAFVLSAQDAKKAEPQYEMTTYYVGLLRKGPAWVAGDTAESRKIQAGHLAHIGKMADAGKLVVAGPFAANAQEVRGMLIFHKMSSIDEVKALVADDPAVKAGRLVLEVFQWMAAKGIKIDPPRQP